MATNSAIEWTEATWNPTVGCTKVSQGCKHCYAEVMHRRLTEMGSAKYQATFDQVRPWRAHLELPLSWRDERLIFVNSMSDLFHDKIELSYIQEVFRVMNRAQQHQFQVLTKRSERLAEVWPKLSWSKNIWMGVSVENEQVIDRIGHLRSVQAASVRFLSIEPLLGPLPELPLNGIHWVIVGGESGPKARPMEEQWAKDIRDACQAAGVQFFLKQLGGRRGKRGGEEAVLDGARHREMPVVHHRPLAMAV